MKLDYLSALPRLDEARGVWLIHGDEPLLSQLLLDRLRVIWRTREVERHRLDLAAPVDWREALGLLDNLSLFAAQTVVEAHGNSKPDSTQLQRLQDFIQQDSDNLLLVHMPKQDSSSQKTKFFQLIDANGTVVSLSLGAHQSEQRQQVLHQEAEQLGLRLDAEAWAVLMAHTENNLLAAHQVLQRLALSQLPPDQTLAAADVLEGLDRQSSYTVFDLANAALGGKPQRALSIMRHLLQADEPAPLILWALSKEMRLLLQLRDQPNNYQALGIWSSRQPLYRQALQRISAHQMAAWPDLLLHTDRTIKGHPLYPLDHLMMECALALCGRTALDIEPVSASS